MNPITNSKIREQFRINNENEARAKEIAINNKLGQDIMALKKQTAPSVSPFIKWGIVIGVGLGLVVGISSHSFMNFLLTLLVCIIASLVIRACRCASVKSYNKSIDDQIAALEHRAISDKKKAYEDADKKTHAEIERYDKEVAAYFKKITNNKDNLKRMCDFACMAFESFLTDAVKYASNDERFVAFNFYYTVSIGDIVYSSSTDLKNGYYYCFKTERYRSLDKNTECEALAAVLTKMISGYVKKKYGSSQAKLKCKNNDANVTLRFEMPNKNFVPATVII